VRSLKGPAHGTQLSRHGSAVELGFWATAGSLRPPLCGVGRAVRLDGAFLIIAVSPRRGCMNAFPLAPLGWSASTTAISFGVARAFVAVANVQQQLLSLDH